MKTPSTKRYAYVVTAVTGEPGDLGDFKVGAILLEKKPRGPFTTWDIYSTERGEITASASGRKIGTGRITPEGKVDWDGGPPSEIVAIDLAHGRVPEWSLVDAAERQAFEDLLLSGEASDGVHTHNELYLYRMLYNAHAAQGWLAAGIQVVKSWRHSDGEECFGGGWFIVVATLPTGQVANHYKAEEWDLFDVPEVDLPPEYDGHTAVDAAERLRAAL